MCCNCASDVLCRDHGMSTLPSSVHPPFIHPHQHHPLPYHQNDPHPTHQSYPLHVCHTHLPTHHHPTHHHPEGRVEAEAVDMEVGGADLEEGAALVEVGRPLLEITIQLGETRTLKRKRKNGQATSPAHSSLAQQFLSQPIQQRCSCPSSPPS